MEEHIICNTDVVKLVTYCAALISEHMLRKRGLSTPAALKKAASEGINCVQVQESPKHVSIAIVLLYIY